jgi:hypothetical protein
VATATESLANPEPKPPVRKRRSFHRRYRKLILAGRILLGVAIAVGLFAIPHFTYNAVEAANCTNAGTDESGNAYRTELQSPECAGVLMNTEGEMRWDASVAMLGVALALSSVVCYRRARRYKPRAPIRPPRQHSTS